MGTALCARPGNWAQNSIVFWKMSIGSAVGCNDLQQDCLVCQKSLIGCIVIVCKARAQFWPGVISDACAISQVEAKKFAAEGACLVTLQDLAAKGGGQGTAVAVSVTTIGRVMLTVSTGGLHAAASSRKNEITKICLYFISNSSGLKLLIYRLYQ